MPVELKIGIFTPCETFSKVPHPYTHQNNRHESWDLKQGIWMLIFWRECLCFNSSMHLSEEEIFWNWLTSVIPTKGKNPEVSCSTSSIIVFQIFYFCSNISNDEICYLMSLIYLFPKGSMQLNCFCSIAYDDSIYCSFWNKDISCQVKDIYRF